MEPAVTAWELTGAWVALEYGEETAGGRRERDDSTGRAPGTRPA